jgi:hypothetical protein
MSSSTLHPAPAQTPSRQWGFSFWLKIALAVWALVFVILVVPFTLLNAWKVGALPAVEGTLSSHRIVEVKQRKSHLPERWVKATLEFDRPTESGLVHCKHEDVTIGPAGKPESFATRAQLAVRRDSCHGYTFLPLHVPSLGEWTGIFLAVGIYLFVLTGILFLALRYQKPAGARRGVADSSGRLE